MSIKNESNNNSITTKAKYWVGVGYPENLREDWQEAIGDLLQLPYEYAIHDADLDGDSDDRKVHVHFIVVFPNSTTYNNALNVFQELSAEGRQAFPTIFKIHNIRHMHNYLIHDTEECRKKKKHPYDPSVRIQGNCFDIGAYEQVGLAEKTEMCKELCTLIVEKGFRNFVDFYSYVLSNYEDINYFDILKTYSGLYERLCKGNFHKWQERIQNDGKHF